MPGGRHERQNPRGSPTGKKLRGDQLAEKVHGRKGMHKDRRKKGEKVQALELKGPEPELAMSDEEFQILWFHHSKEKYDSKPLSWADAKRECMIIGLPNDDMLVDELFNNIKTRFPKWFAYIPYHWSHLKRKSVVEIDEALSSYLRSKQEDD